MHIRTISRFHHVFLLLLFCVPLCCHRWTGGNTRSFLRLCTTHSNPNIILRYLPVDARERIRIQIAEDRAAFSGNASLELSELPPFESVFAPTPVAGLRTISMSELLRRGVRPSTVVQLPEIEASRRDRGRS